MTVVTINKEDRDKRVEYFDAADIYTRGNANGDCEICFGSWGHRYAINTSQYEVEISE